jgi:hypothetical protein
MVVCLHMELLHNSTLRTNVLAGFHTEYNVKLVVWEVHRWYGQFDNMLLVHLVTIIKIDALSDGIAVPCDSALISIKGDTDTGGIHFTKINFDATNDNEDLVHRIPFINLVKIKPNIE